MGDRGSKSDIILSICKRTTSRRFFSIWKYCKVYSSRRETGSWGDAEKSLSKTCRFQYTRSLFHTRAVAYNNINKYSTLDALLYPYPPPIYPTITSSSSGMGGGLPAGGPEIYAEFLL